MNFKSIYSFIVCSLFFMLTACSDAENEKDLVDLFTTASQDLIAIQFIDGTTEDIISIDTFFDYSIEGLKSNGVDVIPISDNIEWSLSDGATSTIDQNGRLSTGSVAETITVNAKFGILITSFSVFVSAAKFDKVIELNSTTVAINLCQSQSINPIGSYIDDDGSEEIRPVDNTTINTITWLIRNQEDDTASQRAFIKTENSQAELQALETGNVIIQARATSLNSGAVVTSDDFNQTLDHNLNSLKLCLKSNTGLNTCTLNNTEVIKDNTISLMTVANYQASNGSNFDQDVSALSKWGTDDTDIATIALSADRQQLNITGNTANSTVAISVACGNVEQTVQNSDIEEGVVLTEPVTCANGNINCLDATADVGITENIQTDLDSLTVTVNNATLTDGTALIIPGQQPITIILVVTANFSDNTTEDVTADSDVTYNNQTTTVIDQVAGTPGTYTVLAAGQAEVEMTFQGITFTAIFVIPN
ncbi:hypothetical protein MNBD_GAMMA06-2259 [hydrothermal vent metagenome]|uniref:BIG2 domain-containing protein n=1 Tax=hydrothermal vent metagenome TaxID=652676 RepID=A0A3B0W5G6_9ZZZZ